MSEVKLGKRSRRRLEKAGIRIVDDDEVVEQEVVSKEVMDSVETDEVMVEAEKTEKDGVVKVEKPKKVDQKKQYKYKCVHGKNKYRCKQGCGSQVCIHNNNKYVCKQCHGSSLCSHNRVKYKCVDCGGATVCPHKKQKEKCIQCKGSFVCPHNKHKDKCPDCGGSQTCMHGRRLSLCRICDIDIHPENWCQSCKHTLVNKSKYKPYCFPCYCVLNPEFTPPKRFKLREHHMISSLKEYYDNVDLIIDKRVDDGCSFKRPDVRIERFTHTIIIECDEHKHTGYSCENKRMMELFQDLGNRSIVFLRFNPDSYTDAETGKVIQGCFRTTDKGSNFIQKEEWNIRISKLRERIDYHLVNIPDKEVTVEHLFYS